MEIALALISFFALVVAWMVLPASRIERARSVARRDAGARSRVEQPA